MDAIRALSWTHWLPWKIPLFIKWLQRKITGTYCQLLRPYKEACNKNIKLGREFPSSWLVPWPVNIRVTWVTWMIQATRDLLSPSSQNKLQSGSRVFFQYVSSFRESQSPVWSLLSCRFKAPWTWPSQNIYHSYQGRAVLAVKTTHFLPLLYPLLMNTPN